MTSRSSEKSVRELFDQAFALHQSNQIGAAESLYRQVLERDPSHAHAVHSLGAISYSRGQHRDAVELFRQAVALKGDEAVFHHSLAQALRADGNAVDAIGILRKALSINPEFVGAWQALADIHYSLEHTEDAARALRKVAELRSKGAESYNQTGISLVRAGRLREACVAFKEGIVCNPDAAGLYYNLGSALMALGQFADAVSCLEHASKQAPRYADAQVALSNALSGKHDLEGALKAQKRALAIDPSLPRDRFWINASPILARPSSHRITYSVDASALNAHVGAASPIKSASRHAPNGPPSAASLPATTVASGSTQPPRATIAITQADAQAVRWHNARGSSFAVTVAALPPPLPHSKPISVLLDEQNYVEALAACDAGLLQTPDSSELLCIRGIVLMKLRKHDQALAALDQALQFQPHLVDALVPRGAVLLQLHRPEEALESGNRASMIQPDSIHALLVRGNALFDLKRYTEALRCFDRVLAISPDDIAVVHNCFEALVKIGDWDSAKSRIQSAIAVRPDLGLLHSDLAVVLDHEGHHEEALSESEVASALDPTNDNVRIGLAGGYYRGGDAAKAEAQLRKALQNSPDDRIARWRLGAVLLATGRYEEGWAYFDSRSRSSVKDIPEWQGQPLTGRSMFVLGEQGHGDEIQFSRYVPVLKALGTSQITLACLSSNMSLFETLPGVDRIVPRDGTCTGLRHDYWTSLMSIPRHCKTTLETIPASLPYLAPLQARIDKWQARIPPARVRVGLVWKGNKDNARDRHRSLSSLALLAPLWRVTGGDVLFVSLQKGDVEGKARHPPANQPLLHLGDDIEDFADTAAILSLLDLTISVDTAAAHLAGALGKRCWVMLPYLSTDWRWMYERSDSPWYPKVLRLFRQPKPGLWLSVVEDVAKALGHLVSVLPR